MNNTGDEGLSLGKLIVGALIVLMIIGLVVGVVYLLADKFSGVTKKVTDTIDSAATSVYSDYDNKEKTGDDVITACKTYRGQNIAIVIEQAGTAHTYSDLAADVTGYNYNALLTGFTAGATGSVTYSPEGYFTNQGIALDANTGLPTLNTNFAPITNKAQVSTTYVKKTARYYSNLIYSLDTGEVCGIVFQRMVE